MNHRHAPLSFLTVWLAPAIVAFLAAIATARADIGSDWLAAQFQSDGSIGAEPGIATAYQATAETLRLWQATGETGKPVIPAALQFLENENYGGSEYLARLILAKNAAGQSVTGLVDALLPRANADGGFGELEDYDGTALDTAFALQALHSSGYGTAQQANGGVDFLLSAQQADGGWEEGANASSVYATALAVIALTPYRTTFQDVPGALTAARNFLLSKRDAFGLWDEDHGSALALIALLLDGAEQSLLQSGIQALKNKQAPNGAWADDVYTTALALRALALYNAAYSGSSGTPTGTVTGYVVKANTHEPLHNVEIALYAAPGYAVSTDAAGFFTLTGVPAGTQTLAVRKSGYSGASHVVTVQSGQISDAGTVALAPDAQTGTLIGRIEDAQDHSAIAGASVTLGGAAEPLATAADAGGGFEWSGLAPGVYSVHIDKEGYHPLDGELTVAAGTSLLFKPALVKTGAYLDATPGDVSGKVIDGETGEPISDARIELADGTAAVSGNGGAFTLNALPRGAYQALLSVDGYQAQALAFVFSPGASGELGVLRLYRYGGPAAPASLTVSGRGERRRDRNSAQ
jgi:hypothetical protein